jgi:Spy/CpxP family protein refolding chaperone
MQRMFDQLGLTDAQKQQIAQIRQTVTDRQQRREAIRNVLTPEQQAKWEQLRAQFRTNSGGGPGGDNNTNGVQGGNGAPAPAPPPGN